VPEHEIEDVLNRTGLNYKRAGSQFVVKDCPYCESSGHPIKGRSDNQWKCYFTRDSGAHFCHRCGHKGSLWDYKRDMGMISATAEHIGGGAREYKLPNQDVVNTYPFDFFRHSSVWSYALEKRKIRQETMEWYKVGGTTYSFEGQSGEWCEEECVTFPWIEFTPTGKEITVRVKARSLADKSHMRLDPPGGRWGWFGWHTVPNDATEIVICEGEWDAMAVYQATKDAGGPIPAISLPNGSRSLPPELLPYLERFTKIWLWMDDDPAGMAGAAQFARKLGDRRTWIVQTRLGKLDGPKDANECLQRGEDILERLSASKPIPHEQLIELADLKAEIYREILNPKEVEGTPIDFLPKLGKIVKGHRNGEMTVLTGGTGQGKCLHALTKILMYDLSEKFAKDIVPGDRLMGPDSRPRTVLTTTSNTGDMFKISPVKGEDWICNDVHVLTLINTSTGEIIDIPLDEYLKRSEKFKHLHKLFRVGIERPEQPTPIDPYLLGLWLGDGTVDAPHITNRDPEVCEYLKALGFKQSKDRNTIRHSISKKLYDFKSLAYTNGEKRIPHSYINNSRDNRLQLLAGLIDTDGFLTDNSYEITTKYDGLKNDILKLARSLGLAAYSSKKVGRIRSLDFTGDYWRILISGHTDMVPCKIQRRKAKPRQQVKNVLRTGFSVTPIGNDAYYGFELDKDGRFLLADFTVTHNTTVLAQHSMALAKRGVRTCWGSFEIKNHRLGKKMLYQFARKTLDKHPGELDKYWEEFTQLPIWMMKFFGSTNVDQVLDCMDYAVYVHDVSHFILDNLQFMTSGQGKGASKFDVQDEAIDKLRAFTTRRNIHTTIVIHPKKITEGMEMDTSSLGGTAKAGQEVDNVWVLQKGQWYRFLDVRKNRYDGDMGMVPYEYSSETHCIRELTDAELDEKKSATVETAVDHGMVSQLGGKRSGSSGGRKKSTMVSTPPASGPQKPVMNFAPGANNDAYHRQFSPGTKQD
jgi:intein/homing endonuclease